MLSKSNFTQILIQKYKSLFKMRLYIILLWCIAWIGSSSAVAQIAPLKFKHYTVQDGLAANMVHTIFQDSYGLIWVGTTEGLSRFDSYNFKNYSSSNDTPNNIGNNYIRSIYQDTERGTLWVGTNRGAYIYRYATDDFEPCPITEIQKSSVMSIKCDSSGNLWMAVLGFGVTRYNLKSGQTKHFRSMVNNPNSLSSNQVTDILIESDSTTVWALTMDRYVNRFDTKNQTFERIQVMATNSETDHGFYKGTVSTDGAIWLGGWSNGLFRIESDLKKVSHFKITNNEGMPVQRIHAVTEMSPEVMLIGSDDGLTTFDLITGKYSTTTYDPNNNRSLSDQFVYPIMKDRNGGVWVGTYFGGLNYISPNDSFFELFTHSSAKDAIHGRIVSRFCEDSQGDIWIGTDDAGLHRFDLKTRQITRIPVSPPEEPLNIHALCADGDNIWVGTYQRGLFKYNTRGRSSLRFPEINDVYALYKDSRGVVWAGTTEALFNIDPQDHKIRSVNFDFGRGIEEIIEDRQRNRIWIASTSKGISCYNMLDGTMQHFDSELTALGLSPNKVRTICLGDGMLWIGIANHGIVRYSLLDQTFELKTILGTELSQRNIHFITLEDRRLWISTSNGLYVYNIDTQQHLIFNREDGLQSNQFNPGAGLHASDGHIYIGGANGFNRFHPNHIKPKANSYPLVFTNMMILNKDAEIGPQSPLKSHINLSRGAVLDHKVSVFTFEFASLNYASSSKSRYRYILKGFDRQYTEVPPGVHTITYTNIPAGDYSFEVLTTNSLGEWEHTPHCISVTILPPWWLSLPMKVLYVILVLMLIGAAIWILLTRTNRRNRLKIANIVSENEQKIIASKIDFFTHIAHEIRTPAALIAAPVEDIFKNCTHSGELTENLEIIHKNSNRLVNLVNQILDLRRTEEPTFEMVDETVDLNQLIQGILSQFQIEAKNRQITVVYDHDPQSDFRARIDGEAMTKIVTNLLSNALKFTKDRITITISNQIQDRFAVTVSDNGQGIEQSKIQDIFKPFYTTDNNTGQVFRGFGIGLSLVSILASKMGITIDVKSQPAQGTTFSLSFARGNVEQSSPEQILIPDVAEPENRPTLSPTSAPLDSECIMIVEDNSDFAYYLNKSIKERYRTRIAENGEEALKILGSEHIDLIISDVAMPVMDGFELCEKIKNNLQLSHIPIILLTAQTDAASKIKGLGGGADVYLEKPVSMEFLYAQMVSLLEKRKSLRDSFLKNPTAPLTSITQNQTDQQFITRLNAIIEENISNTDFSIDQLSRSIYMSRSSLYAKLKGVSDLSPNEFIRVVRLRKAAEYLTNSDYRIGEISYLVGFNNPSYFSRCFFDHYGVLPKDYK